MFAIVTVHIVPMDLEIHTRVHSSCIEVSFETVQMDLAELWMEMRHFDAIVHATGSLLYREKDFRVYMRNNVDLMRQLIDYARQHDVHRVVYCSTIGVYGEFRDEDIDENSDRINPDAYGRMKYAAECLLREESSIGVYEYIVVPFGDGFADGRDFDDLLRSFIIRWTTSI